MFTRVVETEAGIANIITDNNEKTLLEVSLDLQDQLYELVNAYPQDTPNPMYNQLLVLMVLSNINVYNVTENIDDIKSDALFKNVEKSITGLINYIKRTGVSIEDYELITVRYSDEKKIIRFFVNSEEFATYNKNAKKIKNRIVLHKEPIHLSDYFISVYSKIMYNIIEES